MQKSKLFRIIQTFSANDWKIFKKYLLTEVGEGSELISLYDYILKYRKDLDHKNLKLDKANKSLFKNKSRANFQNLLSRIYLYSLDFLVVQNALSDKSKKQLNLVQALQGRGLYSLAKKQLESLESHIENQPLDIWNHLNLAQAYHAIKFSEFSTSIDENYELLQGLSKNWQAAKQDLDSYYHMDGLNDQLIFHYPIDQHLKELKTSLDISKLDNKIKYICEHLVLMRAHQNEASYQHLKSLILNECDSLHPNLSIPILKLCLDYSIDRQKQGKDNVNDIYELNKLGFSKKLLLPHGHIGAIKFYIMTQLTCYIKGVTEGYEWIDKMTKFLEPSIREQTLMLSKAKVAIIDEEVDDALDYLHSVHFESPRLNRMARLNMLISYFLKYQKSPDRFLDNQFENYEKYLIRHKNRMSSKGYDSYQNFVKILKMLKEGYDEEKVSAEIRKRKNIQNRLWLNHYLKKEGQRII